MARKQTVLFDVMFFNAQELIDAGGALRIPLPGDVFTTVSGGHAIGRTKYRVVGGPQRAVRHQVVADKFVPETYLAVPCEAVSSTVRDMTAGEAR
jgi:hypothetical protein